MTPPLPPSVPETLLSPSPSTLLAASRASSCPPPPTPGIRRRVPASCSPKPNLRRLTSRVVELTRRKQLRQILKEVESARKRHGRLNTIVMNAVLGACVHCGDLDAALRVFEEMTMPDNCGVDSISYGTLLKGLGEGRRIDEAFLILESVEKGTAAGSPKLSSQLMYGLLDALLEAGDMRRANGLLARYRRVLQEDGNSILLYNLLIKGYAHSDVPLGALAVRDEMLQNRLKPDRLTYNTLLFACVKSGRMDIAMGLFAEMKEEATKAFCIDLCPDSVTYATLLKGLGNVKDLTSIQNILDEMKSSPGLIIDRVAYTTIVDVLLACGIVKGALCVFGEILKKAGADPHLIPKPHMYLSMMREFAAKGDFDMVKKLRSRMWLDSVGTITASSQKESDELLMEAAINDNKVETARQVLSNIVKRWKGISWRSRGGMVAVRLVALCGSSISMFNPYILQQVSLSDPVEKYMTPFSEAKPLLDTLVLKEVVMRFYEDAVVPIVDDWGSCVGIVHREDCVELDAPLSSMTRGPPLCVTPSTSVGRSIELLLEKKCRILIVVKSNLYGSSYSTSCRPVGVFTCEQLFKLVNAAETSLELTCAVHNSL